MKSFSLGSIGLIILGLLIWGLNWINEGYSEAIVFIGLILLLMGTGFSLIAIAKKENGSIKFISLTSFLLILFLVTLFEPFQVIRIITWLKNIS
ncbi:hypothetical protein ACIQ4I_01725 [Rummeliibacillus sp. NPDC094406]|uniref:hypothetical protein n=1 Tax=Rummeliibacillus sp. NPDC094406 TaxID=3364511 RepID=UPI00380090FD